MLRSISIVRFQQSKTYQNFRFDGVELKYLPLIMRIKLIQAFNLVLNIFSEKISFIFRKQLSLSRRLVFASNITRASRVDL